MRARVERGLGMFEVLPDGEFPDPRRCYARDPVGNRLEFLQPR
ncbi:hypothetical protein [Embleya sp. AB8]